MFHGHITLRKELLAGYLTPSLDTFLFFSNLSKQQLEIICPAGVNPGFYLEGVAPPKNDFNFVSCFVLFVCLFVVVFAEY